MYPDDPRGPKMEWDQFVALLVSIAVFLWILAALAGCSYHREPYPWNRPKAWEYNKHFEGYQSLYDAYKSVTAPEGMRWDPLMGNYQQDLGQIAY